MLFPTFVFTNHFPRHPKESLMSSSTSGPRDAVDVQVLEDPPESRPCIKMAYFCCIQRAFTTMGALVGMLSSCRTAKTVHMSNIYILIH